MSVRIASVCHHALLRNIYSFSYVYMHGMCVGTRVGMRACVCPCMYRDLRLILEIFLGCFPLDSFLRQGLSVKPWADMASLARQLALGFLSLSSEGEILNKLPYLSDIYTPIIPNSSPLACIAKCKDLETQEMTQKLKALVHFQRTQVQFPSHESSTHNHL